MQACETVKPISGLLDIDAGALQTYEGLLALTNLASMNDTVRKRIVKENVFSMVENYMYDTHEELRTASAECMCNLVMCEEVSWSFFVFFHIFENSVYCSIHVFSPISLKIYIGRRDGNEKESRKGHWEMMYTRVEMLSLEMCQSRLYITHSPVYYVLHCISMRNANDII